MNVAIVGYGKMGQKRAKNLAGASLVRVQDFMMGSGSPDPAQIAIISTSHDALAEEALKVINRGQHVLIEKPGGTSTVQIEQLMDAASKQGVKVRVGYNLRYHPALRMAKAKIDEIGPLLYIRAVYGHGGRLGYEKEWRSDSQKGGGVLLDLGTHLLDLFLWFLNYPVGQAHGYLDADYWTGSVEDNAFLIIQTAGRTRGWLHASSTEWKNTFRFEIFGKNGKLQVDGLGGSYGTEKLTLYKMRPQMGPPDITCWEFPREDTSLEDEFRDFLADIELDRVPSCGLANAHAVLRLVEQVKGERF